MPTLPVIFRIFLLQQQEQQIYFTTHEQTRSQRACNDQCVFGLRHHNFYCDCLFEVKNYVKVVANNTELW